MKIIYIAIFFIIAICCISFLFSAAQDDVSVEDDEEQIMYLEQWRKRHEKR